MKPLAFPMIRTSLNNKMPNSLRKKWFPLSKRGKERKTNLPYKTTTSLQRGRKKKKEAKTFKKTVWTRRKSKPKTMRVSFRAAGLAIFRIRLKIQPLTMLMSRIKLRYRVRTLITKMKRQGTIRWTNNQRRTSRGGLVRMWSSLLTTETTVPRWNSPNSDRSSLVYPPNSCLGKVVDLIGK